MNGTMGVIIIVALIIGVLAIFGVSIPREVDRIKRERGSLWPPLEVRHPRLQKVFVVLSLLWVVSIFAVLIITRSFNYFSFYTTVSIGLLGGVSGIIIVLADAREARQRGEKGDWYVQPKFWISLGILVTLPMLVIDSAHTMLLHSQAGQSDTYTFPLILIGLFCYALALITWIRKRRANRTT